MPQAQSQIRRPVGWHRRTLVSPLVFPVSSPRQPSRATIPSHAASVSIAVSLSETRRWRGVSRTRATVGWSGAWPRPSRITALGALERLVTTACGGPARAPRRRTPRWSRRRSTRYRPADAAGTQISSTIPAEALDCCRSRAIRRLPILIWLFLISVAGGLATTALAESSTMPGPELLSPSAYSQNTMGAGPGVVGASLWINSLGVEPCRRCVAGWRARRPRSRSCTGPERHYTRTGTGRSSSIPASRAESRSSPRGVGGVVGPSLYEDGGEADLGVRGVAGRSLRSRISLSSLRASGALGPLRPSGPLGPLGPSGPPSGAWGPGGTLRSGGAVVVECVPHRLRELLLDDRALLDVLAVDRRVLDVRPGYRPVLDVAARDQIGRRRRCRTSDERDDHARENCPAHRNLPQYSTALRPLPAGPNVTIASGP